MLLLLLACLDPDPKAPPDEGAADTAAIPDDPPESDQGHTGDPPPPEAYCGDGALDAGNRRVTP